MSKYREEVLRTAPALDDENEMIGAALGLAGETGEVIDYIKKFLFQGKPWDKNKLIEELGDVRWYLEYMCISVGTTLEEVEEANVNKLRKRYPNGFSADASNNRKE